MDNIDNSKCIEEKWAPDRDTVILKYEVPLSARKCEWNHLNYESELKRRLDPERFAENFRHDRLDAVDFKNWGRNPWHSPKDEVDAYNEAKPHITNEDIILEKAEFAEEDTIKDMEPYHEKKVVFLYAVNVTQVLEREKTAEAER